MSYSNFRLRRLWSHVLIAFAAVSFHAVAADLPDLGESSRVILSPQMEKRIGESIMTDIRLHEPSYVDDPEINDYLAELGGHLAEAGGNQRDSFHFFAIRDNSINAFAMFGGFIGVNTGTILVAQSESELAGVLGHEIGHVMQDHLARQLAKEKQNTIPALAALAVGILAARANSSVAAATITSTQAGMVQAQLAYSRDFEREADRVGYQTLSKAGFDVRAMGDFFERLQQAGRLYDYSAPVYLRSHPLTSERIADMQNRAQTAPYRQILSSLDFLLIRAKLRAQANPLTETIKEFESQLQEKKYSSLAATQYGLAFALMRAKDVPRAQHEMEALKQTLRESKSNSPLIARLDAEIRLASGDVNGALNTYREAIQTFPRSNALVYAYAETLLDKRPPAEAQKFIETRLHVQSHDYTLYELLAKAHALQGKRLAQYRAQAEFYYWRGELGPAIEQLNFAQQAKDGDFYEHSKADARLRELRLLQLDEERRKRED